MSNDQRPFGGTAWHAWRAFIGGVIYLGAAIFNTVYTLPQATDAEIFEGYAEGAWFGFLAEFVRDVLQPNAVLFMSLVVVFEVAVGILILSRGRWVDMGAIASLGWVAGILPFLAWPYLLVNVVLFVMQGAILLRRYDASIWSILRRPSGVGGVPQPR